jgi:lipoprotein-anchoring transpeptidase ErfK/SrfK
MRNERNEMRHCNLLATITAALLWAAALALPVGAQTLSPEAINRATFGNGWQRDTALLIKTQVLLDRARFSPGVIDGRWGMNTERAIRAFQQHHGLAVTGRLDDVTWRELGSEDQQDVTEEYRIGQADVKGPFIRRVPESFKAMAKLPALSYTSAAELLAERFHMDINLLRKLNRGASLRKAGTQIVVTAVRDETRPDFNVARIEVKKSDQAVIALDGRDNVLAYYPATVGSRSMPSPAGKHTVTVVVKRPNYTYNPEKLSFPGVHLRHPVTIKPGPNNPVGRVWIGLTEEGYGIHGSPDPSAIRRQASHGCVRLTNWDAIELANATKPGTAVVFVK